VPAPGITRIGVMVDTGAAPDIGVTRDIGGMTDMVAPARAMDTADTAAATPGPMASTVGAVHITAEAPSTAEAEVFTVAVAATADTANGL
jgi:hypothetical protein